MEECASLEQYKQQLTTGTSVFVSFDRLEMDDLTTTLFEEAHEMVRAEKVLGFVTLMRKKEHSKTKKWLEESSSENVVCLSFSLHFLSSFFFANVACLCTHSMALRPYCFAFFPRQILRAELDALKLVVQHLQASAPKCAIPILFQLWFLSRDWRLSVYLPVCLPV